MTEYQLLCYRASFESFNKLTSSKIPANSYDEFALLVCVSKKGKVGFNSSEAAEILLGSLAKGSYVLAGGRLSYVSTTVPGESRSYAFKPKDDSFQRLLKEYEKAELDAKKFQIMSRNGRACLPPASSILSGFLKNIGHPISTELYQRVIETCHYVTKEIASGEHGYGAFEVFSDNLDVFFSELKELIGKSGELIFVNHSQIPYH